jgi:hypothetical protein
VAPGPTRIVSVVTPAAALFEGGQPIDLVALADVKLELNLTETNDDAWLAKTITRLSAAANAFCQRVLVAQAYLEQIWSWRDPYPWQSPTRVMPLQLARWPLAVTPSPSGTAPPQAPALAAVAGGALAARGYSARLSYVTPAGETAASLPASISLSADTLISVAAPGPDLYQLATGWNVYASETAGAETLQNATPIALGDAWTEPTGGLVAGNALPAYVLAVENASPPFQPNSAFGPTPLAEGVDFVADAETGELTRLSAAGLARSWNTVPVAALYPAGFTAATLPGDLSDALILLVKARWFGRNRDPLLRSSNVEGVLAQTWALGAGLGAETDFPPDVQAKLERYRVPTAL